MAARSVNPEAFPLCASGASQPQPLVGLKSTRQERNRYRYVNSTSCGFIEVADERLTSKELGRILVTHEQGVAEKTEQPKKNSWFTRVDLYART
jgi:hypothetical protein